MRCFWRIHAGSHAPSFGGRGGFASGAVCAWPLLIAAGLTSGYFSAAWTFLRSRSHMGTLLCCMSALVRSVLVVLRSGANAWGMASAWLFLIEVELTTAYSTVAGTILTVRCALCCRCLARDCMIGCAARLPRAAFAVVLCRCRQAQPAPLPVSRPS